VSVPPGNRRVGAIHQVLWRIARASGPGSDELQLGAVLGRLFWRDLELHHPGIDSLRLPPAVAEAWKQRLRVIRDRDGNPLR
jgi:hypothetical protein